jgi:23S rRNA pseudouridine1911/1915/1917 synthase
MVVCEPSSAGAVQATATFHKLRSKGDLHWVEIQPVTGRKHQLRVHLASRGWPIVGDRKYGGQRSFEPGIALHARKLAIEHPVRKERLEFEAPLPASWGQFAALCVESS